MHYIALDMSTSIDIFSMLSLSNNLLLHRKFDPKDELVPKKGSKTVEKLDRLIREKSKIEEKS